MLDWDDLRFFLAVARHRTLAEAARHLQVTHTTVNRRLTSLQEKLGVRLLRRTANGFVPTLAGESIRPHVERLEIETLAVERTVAGHDVRQQGTVRVVSSELLTSHLLAPSFTALHAVHRDILVEALPDIPGEPLATQQADIAVRLGRFEHPDLVVRKIGVIAFGLYCCIAYLARYGIPDPESGCSGHQLITLQGGRDSSSLQSAWLAQHASCAQVVLRADSYETQHWSAASGGGLAVLPRFRADAEPTLHRILTVTRIPSAEIWLGVHRENRPVPRIRTVLDCITNAVRSRADVLAPPEGANIATSSEGDE
jgi:DNA-binding transcriptional LysR family regulator